ncbi:hypothetical protein [Aminipila luticellarii]|uniref:Uncharacterized protein n=1 Tax=Aminipila luticellarii TaxID=2507160 RepID=A0A410PVH8_9FIRM|nr:hypothetical protein [Aminipila luticellarii]QAT42924.1 hypothetical protein EQM06_06560 [Aminipila luticellarii]
MEDVVTEPLYVQKVYDAVLFNLQGMKTVQNQNFSPNLPRGHRVKRVLDIRCKRFFNPGNIDDSKNLSLNLNTTISGATFLHNGQGNPIEVVGPDGTFSEKILYADTSECDEQCMGTPVFGTQTIDVTGNVQVFIDLLLCDRNNNEVVFTVCADVNIATSAQPLVLTNFFEICMPSTIDTAFLPRFTEFCNAACETRLATNNCGRDLAIGQNGEVSANLIIAICITCEKKIIVPVQLCVLSTGFAQISPQVNAVCSTFPSLFPNQIKESDTEENCEEVSGEEETCDPCNPYGSRNSNSNRNYNNSCNNYYDDDDDGCNDFSNNQCRPNRSNRSQNRR